MRTQIDRRDGSALLTVMLLCSVLVVAGISMTFITGNSAHRARKLHNHAEALAIAEAGVGHIVRMMETEGIAQWMNTNVTVEFAGGRFTAVTTFNNANGNILIESTGYSNDAEKLVAAEVLGDVYLAYDAVLGIGGSVVAGGDITIETAAGEITGGIHANGNIYSDNSPTTISGSITTCGTISGTFDGFTSQTAGTAPVVVPDYQPFTSWKDLAMNGGIYYPNSVVLGGVNLTPGNGVVYCEGSITIGQNSSLHGTLVAAENVDIGQRFRHTPWTNGWPAVLAGMDVDIGQNGNYDGVIFAGANIRIVNHQDRIQGAIIALTGNVHIRNRVIVEPLSSGAAYTPSGEGLAPPEVIIGGWLR